MGRDQVSWIAFLISFFLCKLKVLGIILPIMVFIVEWRPCLGRHDFSLSKGKEGYNPFV